MDTNQKIANWSQHFENGVNIIINVKEYNLSQEKRQLIPFIARTNKKGESNKMGMLNCNGEVILQPFYDAILDDCYSDEDIVRVGILFPYGYSKKNGEVSSYVRYKYKAMKANGEFITDMDFDCIIISTDNKFITVQDRNKGYAVFDRMGKEIVPFGKYAWIDGFHRGFSRVKIGMRSNGYVDDDNKWGVINEYGEEVIPCVYPNIWNFYGKDFNTIKVVDDKVMRDVSFSSLRKKVNSKKETPYEVYVKRPTYNEYNGSYAQDIMGYSDDVISDAFEGDPDAYWNID